MDYTIGSAVARTILGNPVLGTICIQTTIQCLQTLAVTTQEIYGFISTIKTTTQHVNIATLLTELDLESEVLVLESLLREINIEKHHTQTLAICLKLLDECLGEIHKLLSEVHKRMDYNSKLWVDIYGLRTKKFDDISDKMRFLKNNLDKRKDNLFEVLKINQYLTNSTRPSKNIQLKGIPQEYEDMTSGVEIVSMETHQSAIVKR